MGRQGAGAKLALGDIRDRHRLCAAQERQDQLRAGEIALRFVGMPTPPICSVAGCKRGYRQWSASEGVGHLLFFCERNRRSVSFTRCLSFSPLCPRLVVLSSTHWGGLVLLRAHNPASLTFPSRAIRISRRRPSLSQLCLHHLAASIFRLIAPESCISLGSILPRRPFSPRRAQANSTFTSCGAPSHRSVVLWRSSTQTPPRTPGTSTQVLPSSPAPHLSPPLASGERQTPSSLPPSAAP